MAGLWKLGYACCSRPLKMAPLYRTHTTWSPIVCTKYSSILVGNSNFFHTPSHSSSTPSSFAIGILPYRLVQKNCRIAWLTARWLKSLMISFRQNTGVWQTDRRIDRKTDRQTVRAMHTRRAVKTVANVFALFFHNRTRSLGWDGVNRFCKKSFVYSRLKRVTKRWEVRRKTNLDQCQSICNVTVAKMMYFCWNLEIPIFEYNYYSIVYGALCWSTKLIKLNLYKILSNNYDQ